MSIHVHVSHHQIEEIHVYAETEAELHQWVAAWEKQHEGLTPRVIPVDRLSVIVQSRKRKS
jgi:hypothetical protein